MAKQPNTTSVTTKATTQPAKTTPSARTESKKTRLIEMLCKDGGTTIAAISAALDWQPHTTRAAITGLRKSGHEVETAKPGDGGPGLIYRIALSDGDGDGDGAGARAHSSSEAGQ